MYYGMIIFSVILFGTCFFFKDEYRKLRGNSFKISLQYSITGSFFGLLVLLIINRFNFSITLFTLIMAIITSANGIIMGYLSFKALEKINLSLYSVFCMLGGMLLPFVQGIVFYNESITLSKILCLILVTVSLFLTVEKGTDKKGFIYYAGVFVLNGMSGVLSMLYNELPFYKADAASYSILTALMTIIISAIILYVFLHGNKINRQNRLKADFLSGISGAANKIANYILLIALLHVDASVQYPMVTGGTMIVSTIYCFIGGAKPKKKEILSVIIAFLGMFVLIF